VCVLKWDFKIYYYNKIYFLFYIKTFEFDKINIFSLYGKNSYKVNYIKTMIPFFKWGKYILLNLDPKGKNIIKEKIIRRKAKIGRW
jgi:hypothetical protein